MPWPEVVPILTEKDICRGTPEGPGDTHCLAGWLNLTFGGYGKSWAGKFDSTAYRQAEKAIINACGTKHFVGFNDNLNNPKAKIAKVWNRAMRALGYRVPCARS